MHTYKWWQGLSNEVWWALREEPQYEEKYQRAIGRHVREAMALAYENALQHTRQPTPEELKAQEEAAEQKRKRQEEEEAAQAEKHEHKKAKEAWLNEMNWMQTQAKLGMKIRKVYTGRGWRRKGFMPVIYEDHIFLWENRMHPSRGHSHTKAAKFPKLDISIADHI